MNASRSLLLLLSLAAPLAFAKPAEKAPEMTPEIAQLLATQNVAARDFKGAEKVLRDAQKKFPAAHGFHLGLGAVEEARGNVRAALWEYQWELLRAGAERPSGEEAVRRSSSLVSSTSTEAARVRAVLEAMAGAGSDPKAALALVKKERASGDAFILRVYETELRAGSGDADAETLFRELLKIDASFVPAMVGLAQAQHRAGRADEAAATLEAARKLDADHWLLRR